MGVDTSPSSAYLIANSYEIPFKRFQNGDGFA